MRISGCQLHASESRNLWLGLHRDTRLPHSGDMEQNIVAQQRVSIHSCSSYGKTEPFYSFARKYTYWPEISKSIPTVLALCCDSGFGNLLLPRAVNCVRFCDFLLWPPCVADADIASWRNFARCKVHFASKSCLLLYWQRYCAALHQRASAKLRHGTRNGITGLSQKASPIFGWAAITLGIGPHSSCIRY